LHRSDAGRASALPALSQSPIYNVNNDIWFMTANDTIFAPNHQRELETMKRYVIERDLPGIGGMNRAQLKDAAATSNSALAKLAGKCQWEHSYVVDNKTFCIYLAENEAAVKEHAKLSGFPATKISEVRTVIDSLTAVAA
jgi:Nickel responsive protein SCO4226-like